MHERGLRGVWEDTCTWYVASKRMQRRAACVFAYESMRAYEGLEGACEEQREGSDVHMTCNLIARLRGTWGVHERTGERA